MAEQHFFTQLDIKISPGRMTQSMFPRGQCMVSRITRWGEELIPSMRRCEGEASTGPRMRLRVRVAMNPGERKRRGRAPLSGMSLEHSLFSSCSAVWPNLSQVLQPK